MEDIIYSWGGYNEELFYLINKACNSSLCQIFMKYISIIFDIEMIAIYYSLIMVVLLYRIWKLQNYEHYSFCYDTMARFGVCYALFGLIYAALKFGINMPRPFCSLPLHKFTTILNTSHERCLSSFPSSHTGLVFLITMFLWKDLGMLSRIIWLCLVALVASSRIALAMHYPADIIYSLLIAYIVYFQGIKIYKFLENNIISLVKKTLWNLIHFFARKQAM